MAIRIVFVIVRIGAGHVHRNLIHERPALIQPSRQRFDEALQELRNVADILQLPDAKTRVAELERAIVQCLSAPRRALLVGIDDYWGPDVQKLPDAVSETRLFGLALERCDFQVEYLLDRNATHGAIMNAAGMQQAEMRHSAPRANVDKRREKAKRKLAKEARKRNKKK